MDGSAPQFLNGPVAWWTVGRVGEETPPLYEYGVQGDDHWDHYYATFNGPRVRLMAESGLIPMDTGGPHFCAVADVDSFTLGFTALHAAIEADGPQSATAINLLEGLLLQLQTQTPLAAVISPLERAVQGWLEQIRQAPQHDWSLEEQAKLFAVSPGHLRRVATRLAAMPPHRFVMQRRLDLAATQLRKTNKPIKVLAGECGFEDVPHFTRLFSRRYGISPAAYRSEVQRMS